MAWCIEDSGLKNGILCLCGLAVLFFTLGLLVNFLRSPIYELNAANSTLNFTQLEQKGSRPPSPCPPPTGASQACPTPLLVMGKKEGGKMGELLLQSVLSAHHPPASPTKSKDTDADDGDSGSQAASPWVQLVLLHCGLVLLCGVYILGGACAMYVLESPNEHEQRRVGLERLAASKDKLMSELSELGQDPELSEAKMKQEARKLIDSHVQVLFESHQNPFIRVALDGDANPKPEFEPVWNIKSAILIALTIVTTVGYGYITPITKIGRMFTISFGLLGIPLTLVTTADLARFMGVGVVTVMLKAKKLILVIKTKLHLVPQIPKIQLEGSDSEEDEASVPISLTLLILISYPILGGLWFVRCGSAEGWAYPDAVYFATVTILTVGFGDIELGSGLHCFLPLLFYLVAGIIVVTMCVDLVGSEWIDQIHFLGRKIGKAKLLAGRMRSGLGGLGALMSSMATTQRALAQLQRVQPFAPADWDEFKFAEARRSLLPSRISNYETFDSFPDA